jgi:MFS family permease
MRPEVVAWERAGQVRVAAQGWRRAGAIDDLTLRTIREAFPDPRLRPGMVWRVVTACVVAAVMLCALGAFSIASGMIELQALLFLFAGLALVATDLMEASPRFARRGAAGATSFLGVGFVLAAAGLFLVDTVRVPIDDGLDMLLVIGLLACGASAWRWGSPVFAGLAAASLFLLLGRLPYGRAWWLLVGAALAAAAARRLDAAGWAPPHRLGAAVVLVIGVGAVYAAVNLYSLDHRVLEALSRFGAGRPTGPPGLRIVAAIATAAGPLAVLGWGIRTRRTFLIDAGIVLLAVSFVTLRHYVHVAPTWVMLTLSGVLVVILALTLERALRRAPAGEIHGFTADPLFTDERRQYALQAIPVAATLTPAPTGPAAEREGLAGDGRFGGGGASERF